MTEIADRYARLSGDLASTIDGVPTGHWDDPSPCEDWNASAVVAHVVQSQRMFEGMVGRELNDVPGDDDPAGAFAAVSEQVEDHLRDPEAAGATFEGMSGPSTFAEGVDRFICADLVVHRWDLATATGQEVSLPPEEIERVWADMRKMGDALRGRGAFGPEVEVSADADLQTRFLAFLGRSA